MKLIFLHYSAPYNAGEVATFADETKAKSLVDSGAARPWKPEDDAAETSSPDDGEAAEKAAAAKAAAAKAAAAKAKAEKAAAAKAAAANPQPQS